MNMNISLRDKCIESTENNPEKKVFNLFLQVTTAKQNSSPGKKDSV